MNIWLVVWSMMAHPTQCQAIANDRIFGADLAKAIPGFANKIPADAVIGYSPLPGARRSFSMQELQHIGAPYGVAVEPGADACFEWSTQTLTPEMVQAAMRDSLQLPQAHIEILELPKGRVPAGKIRFPIAGLVASTLSAPETALTWHGEVLPGGSRKFPISVRVKISARTTRVVAMQALTPGETIAVSQVRVEEYDDFPLRNDVARDLNEALGRMARRPLHAGQPILRADLIEPLQVQRGEAVNVTAISGAAELHLIAIAETPGRQGDVISLKNSHSGKSFRARIEGKDRAVVIAWPEQATSARLQ